MSVEDKGASQQNLSFDRYIALGDSISIDKYPAADLQNRDWGVGAASLFHRNEDELWPEFRGVDLATLVPGIRYRGSRRDYELREGDNLTEDGWTTRHVLHDVKEMPPSSERTLVTLTVGGNDLLGAVGFYGREAAAQEGPDPAKTIAARLHEIVERLFDVRPETTLIVGTVYDPSDGTNRLPMVEGSLERQAEWLARYNQAVRDLVAADPRLHLADIHQHFLGHGMTAPPEERWYWSGLIIEPSAHGASEVRRLWIDALAAMATKEVE
jgi:lysophospholipase L1-like esterase